MSISNGIIVAPVSIDDVRSALGEASTDLGTLCKSSKINMFAKYKPIRHTAIGELTIDGYTRHGLVYNLGTKTITYNKPTGGDASPYRLTDFIGYNHREKSPSIDDMGLATVVDMAVSTFAVSVEPYLNNALYDWGSVLGYSWSTLKLKIEVYDQRMRLIHTATVGVSDIDATGKISFSASSIGIEETDTVIYVKGCFCDPDGALLAAIPTSAEYVEKPLNVTASVKIYIGEVTIDSSAFTVRGEMVKSSEATVRITVGNPGDTAYEGATGRPYAQCRWRAADGSYTGTYIGGVELENCKSIPAYMERTDAVNFGGWPTVAREWYLDVKVYMY